MTEQQPDSLLEVKIPIFSEFIFQKNLAASDVEGDGKPFYKHIADSLEKPDSDFFFHSDGYSLPGFPGIQYFFYVYMDEEKEMVFEFAFNVDYKTHLFDVDFTCTINKDEPIQFHYTLDNLLDEEPSENYLLFNCSNECAGCAACEDKFFVVRVEGTCTVKYVDHIRISYDFSSEDTRLCNKNEKKDFVFVVEGKKIRVHKSILIKNSTVFARMLDSEKWNETTENKIVIPEFSYKVVDFAVKAFYGLYHYRFLEIEDYLMLSQFADKYDMDQLKKAVKKSIVLTPHNVVKRANFFLQNFADELVDCCIDYILACSQNSFTIKDIDMLDPQVQSMFFNRTLISPVQKKDPKLEHRFVYKDKE